jgi:hypothetical protein
MESTCWTSLPHDMRLLILEHVPLLQLAQMAPLGKEMWAAYLARLALREAIISGLPRVHSNSSKPLPASLGSLLEFHPPSCTALPRDLVGVPEVRSFPPHTFSSPCPSPETCSGSLVCACPPSSTFLSPAPLPLGQACQKCLQ